MKKVLIILLTIIFLSCVSTSPNKLKTLSSENSYIGGHFNGVNYSLYLKNLDTGKRIQIKFIDNPELQIKKIEPGDYAITWINGKGFCTRYLISLPIDLMHVIKIRKNQIIYLGTLNYRKNYFLYPTIFLFGNNDGELNNYLNFEEAITEFKNTYGLSESLEFKSIYE